MAKKRFNISQTLNKNKTQKTESELPEKVALPKTTIEDDTIKQKVKAIEQPEKKVTKKTTSKKEKKVEIPLKMVRLTIDTPEEMHKKLKIRSIESGMTMREYVLKLVENSLKKK